MNKKLAELKVKKSMDCYEKVVKTLKDAGFIIVFDCETTTDTYYFVVESEDKITKEEVKDVSKVKAYNIGVYEQDIAKAFQFGFCEKNDKMDVMIDKIKNIITSQPKKPSFWRKCERCGKPLPYMAEFCRECTDELLTEPPKPFEQQEESKDAVMTRFNNLCNSCLNARCEFQSDIIRTKCDFYMPPHAVSDTLIVTFDNNLDDEAGICVSRVVNEKIVVLKMELGEQADILYKLLTEQTAKAESEELVVNDDKLALLEKTYNDFCRCKSGEGWLKIDGKEYSTDVGYALDGIRIFMEVYSKRLAEIEG